MPLKKVFEQKKKGGGGAKPPFSLENFFPLSGGTESPENFKGGSVRRRRKKGYKPPEGSPEFFSCCTVFRGLRPSEATEARPSRRAKRGSTERSEAPPSVARLHRGSAERSEAARRSSGVRHYKLKLKLKVPPESPLRGTTHLFFGLKIPGDRRIKILKKKRSPEVRKSEVRKSEVRKSEVRVSLYFLNF